MVITCFHSIDFSFKGQARRNNRRVKQEDRRIREKNTAVGEGKWELT